MREFYFWIKNVILKTFWVLYLEGISASEILRCIQEYHWHTTKHTIKHNNLKLKTTLTVVM